MVDDLDAKIRAFEKAFDDMNKAFAENLGR